MVCLIVQVIGVEELGYRKRLQYGISELRSAHPEWNQGRIVSVVI